MIVVVMEYCDMDTLLRAIQKKAFQPHGKWSAHTTYVRPQPPAPAACAASERQACLPVPVAAQPADGSASPCPCLQNLTRRPPLYCLGVLR